MIYSTLLDTIGNTPLIKLNHNGPHTLLAKLEYLNPAGSIKDRAALYMINQAEKDGLLQPGGTLIEASSGNQGIATAMIGAAKGYKVIITTNDKFSKEKIMAIKAYGAQVIMCPCTEFVEDSASYHSQALALQKSIANSFMLNQYYNLNNAQAHYQSIAPELWQQTAGTISHVFASAGTCGTISGIGKYLKEKNEKIQIIGVDSEYSFRTTKGFPKPYKLEGIGVDFKTPILEKYQSYIDSFAAISDQEGFMMLKELVLQHGLLCGPSSGAAMAAHQRFAHYFTQHDVVVVILADSGRAYLSKNYFDHDEIRLSSFTHAPLSQ